MHVSFTTGLNIFCFFGVDIDNTLAGRCAGGAWTHFPNIAHGLLEHRHIDDVTGSLCSLFYSIWRPVLKMFARSFRITKRRHRKKLNMSCLQRRKMEKPGQRVLDDLKIPKLEEIFTTVAIECHRSLRASSPFGRACLQASVIATRDSQF